MKIPKGSQMKGTAFLKLSRPCGMSTLRTPRLRVLVAPIKRGLEIEIPGPNHHLPSDGGPVVGFADLRVACRQVSCLNISQCLNPSRGSLDREDTSFDALWDLALPGGREETVDMVASATHESLGDRSTSTPTMDHHSQVPFSQGMMQLYAARNGEGLL